MQHTAALFHINITSFIAPRNPTPMFTGGLAGLASPRLSKVITEVNISLLHTPPSSYFTHRFSGHLAYSGQTQHAFSLPIGYSDTLTLAHIHV